MIYSAVTIDDLSQMLELYTTYLNEGESVEEYLREGLSNKRYCGMKCMDGNRLAGVFTARPGVEFTFNHEDIVQEICDAYPTADLFTADMLVVLPAYRGKGVARVLADGLREDLSRKGCDYLVIEEWHRHAEDDVPVSGVLKYIGDYVTHGVYQDFYRGCEEYGYTCPECGVPCQCGALVCVVTIA